MKERKRNNKLERHHILPKCIVKAFGLGVEVYDDPTNIELLKPKEHDLRHTHTEEDLAMVKSLVNPDVKYRVRIIPREEVIVFDKKRVYQKAGRG